MSVRAYKIITKTLAKEPSFNVWHDDFVLDLAYQNIGGEDGGILEFEKERIETAIEELKALKLAGVEKEEGEEWTVCEKLETLLNVLDDFTEGEDFIQYECY